MLTKTHLTHNKLYKNVKKYPVMYLMILPAVGILFLFHYIPIYGIVIAFQKFSPLDGYGGSRFVGFDNFIRFFKDPFFFRVVRNTVVLGVIRMFWDFWPSIVFAILLNELGQLYFKKIVQSISYLPHFISTVIVVGILFKIVAVDGGLANRLLQSLGFEKINFLITPGWFRPLYIITDLWKGIGWGSIIYLAAISGIDQELYDAAFVDGAKRFRRIWHITLPGMAPTIIILLILSIRGIVNIGTAKVLLMYNPAIYETADVIATYVYRKGIIGTDQSYAAAIGLFNAIISFILIVAINKAARSMSETSLW